MKRAQKVLASGVPGLDEVLAGGFGIGGIELSEPLRGMHGVLTGVPRAGHAHVSKK